MSSFLPPKTPRSVTIVLWGVFILGVVSLWQAVSIARQLAVLHSLDVPTTPLLIQQGLAVIWAGLFFILLVVLRWRRPWSRTAVPVALFAYTLYHLVARLLSQSANLQQQWIIWVLLSGSLIGFSWWALKRSAVSSYFDK